MHIRPAAKRHNAPYLASSGIPSGQTLLKISTDYFCMPRTTYHKGLFCLFSAHEKMRQIDHSHQHLFCCHLNFRSPLTQPTWFCCVNNRCQQSTLTLDGVYWKVQMFYFMLFTCAEKRQKNLYCVMVKVLFSNVPAALSMEKFVSSIMWLDIFDRIISLHPCS